MATTATRWEYGGFHHKHDMSGVIALPNDSLVQVMDWTKELPVFMCQADTIFVDPPWNTGNMNSFYTKADLPHREFDFDALLKTLFSRISQISPQFLFMEIGKEALHTAVTYAHEMYRYVTFYNSTYNKKPTNKCYVIHATNDARRRRYSNLEDMGQGDIIAWLCANHEYQCIGDLCMGRGRVGREAYKNGRRFVGTELNRKRLAALVDWIKEREALKHAIAQAN